MHSPELTVAIDALYDAFAAYPRPATFIACGCCWEGREIPGARWKNTKRPLVEVEAPGRDLPLREVPVSRALAELGEDVPLTGGDLALFKHYLPRLCEIVTGERFEGDWPDLYVIRSHLDLGPDLGCRPWREWPDNERAAVARFLAAVADRERD
jgi:hypothetical protein